MLSRRRCFGLPLGLLFAPALQAALPRLRFQELYGRRMVFSARVQALTGQRVVIRGFMAPPLKAQANFFVLTRMPMAVCPFCDNEADWPSDIILVLMERIVPAIPFNRPIDVRGILETGVKTDPATGFVSRMRLVDADVERV